MMPQLSPTSMKSGYRKQALSMVRTYICPEPWKDAIHIKTFFVVTGTLMCMVYVEKDAVEGHPYRDDIIAHVESVRRQISDPDSFLSYVASRFSIDITVNS